MTMVTNSYLDRWLPALAAEGGSGEAAAPAPASPAPTGGEASAEDFAGFSDVGDDDFEIEVSPAPSGEAAPTSSPAAPAEPAVPAAPAAEAPPPPPAKPEPTVPPPQPPQTPEPKQEQPQAAPGEASPDAPPSAPEDLASALSEHKDALVSALAQERFTLSQEEKEAFETDPVSAAPRLMARAYYEAVHTTLNHIANMVPRIIEQTIQVREAHEKAIAGFFGQFKALDRGKHLNDVLTMARAFKQANPQMPQGDLNAMVGAAVMAKYGLVPQAPAPGGNGIRQPAPFTPAPSGPAPGRQVSADTDPWAGLDDMGD